METEVSYNTYISCKGRKKKTKATLGKTRRRILPGLIKSLNESSSFVPVEKKTTLCPVRRKQKNKKPQKNKGNSVLEDLCIKVLSEDKTTNSPKPSKSLVFNSTVDLCDDNSNESHEVKVSDPHVEKSDETEVLFDVDKNKLDQKEVIDLTENSILSNNSELCVIDLSEEEEEEKNGRSSENGIDDEILVIGTFSKTSKPSRHKKKSSKTLNYIPLSSNSNKLNSLINLGVKVKKKYLKKENKNSRTDTNKNWCRKVLSNLTPKPKITEVGENVYSSSPMPVPENGLRPIIIDGSNVAFVHTNSYHFCCKRLESCIRYFKERGHKVTAFVPQFRLHRSDNPQLLKDLERQGDVILTPSKTVDGVQIVPYDDRFIVQTAVLKGGVIVSRDNYNDLLKENPAWADTIKYRTLAFTWVDDVLIFPKDPLGVYGPSLEEFLKF